MSTKRAAGAASVVLSLAVTVAACGDGRTEGGANGQAASSAAAPVAASASASPTERLESATGVIILQKAQAEFAKITSVKLTGFEVEDGTRSTFTVSVDNKRNCTGTVKMEGHGSAELLRVDGKTFVRYDAALLAATRGAKFAESGKDRWFKMVEGEESAALAEVCDLSRVPAFGDGTPVERGLSDGSETVDGRRTVKLFVPGTVQGDSVNAKVAAEGPTLPVRLEALDETYGVDFSDYNAPVTVTAPPADQVVDLATLKATSGS